MTQPAILVDLDGTVADLTHRLHHISGNRRDWDKFFEGVGNDSPILTTMLAVDAFRDFIEDTTLIFVSGRPEKTREATVNWLHSFGYRPADYTLLMRPDGDTRPDYVVKEEILDNILGQGYHIECVFDDRPSVIEMWKRRGLHVFQVHAPGVAAPDTANTATLHLLVGASHSGKTTWLDTCQHGGVILSSDRLRYQLTGNAYDQTRNDEVFALLHSLTRTYLQAGVNVWYDATNLRRKDRLAAVALNGSGPVVYHVFDRPLADKLRDLRPGFPAHVVEKHHQTFISQRKDILAGDNLPNVTVEIH